MCVQTCMAIMAEVEERVLRTDNFEDIITCLKSDPAQWSDDKLRGLLTAAYLSSVSEEELKLAGESVVAADASGLSRRTSQVSQSGTAPEGSSGLDDRAGEGPQACEQVVDAGARPTPEKAASAEQLADFADIMKQELGQLQWAGPSASRGSTLPAPLGSALDAKSLLRLSGDVGASRDADESDRVDVGQNVEENAAPDSLPAADDQAGSEAPKQSPAEGPPFQLGDDESK